MSLLQLLRQPVTIQNRAPSDVTDASGDTIYEDDGDPIDTEGYLEQTDSTEVLVDRETYLSDWLLVLRADIDVRANSVVTVGDDDYEVVGPPKRVWNPRLAMEHHIECRLRRSEG